MKKIFGALLLVSAFGAQAMDLPEVTVKDRLRLELWSFGMDQVKLQDEAQESRSNVPRLSTEISKPLRELVLEL